MAVRLAARSKRPTTLETDRERRATSAPVGSPARAGAHRAAAVKAPPPFLDEIKLLTLLFNKPNLIKALLKLCRVFYSIVFCTIEAPGPPRS